MQKSGSLLLSSYKALIEVIRCHYRLSVLCLVVEILVKADTEI